MSTDEFNDAVFTIALVVNKIYSKAIHEQKPKGQNTTTKTFEALLDNRTIYNSKIPASQA
jgi:hypothetical protein